ncbi:MAG: hypothetical protein QOE54_1728 [Streptosporangiaceae bacterium]|jgi:hypothetical protein|nr:hypothetical protein [Streptosporangiaceae bacterium]MDX6429362.1 hypothetical protein [Streptosporangiaceae bacterium]
MFRKALVIPVLLLALTACGGANDAARIDTRVSVSASASAMSPMAATSCPTAATKKFAKTRFVADLGLAFGSFNRYILKPYKAGTFKPNAAGRTKALIKAAAAGAFAINRLNAARRLVNDDPTLCKTLKAPLDALWTQLSALTSKLKSGNVDPALISGASGVMEGVRQKAGKQGVPVKDE